jgi:photosystem II stability/assembly factor-like uncharacterized protein
MITSDICYVVSAIIMTTILIGVGGSIRVRESTNNACLFILESTKNGWNGHEFLKGTNPTSLAFDPLSSNRAYYGTLSNGLWKTDDGGQTWSNIGRDVISSPYVTSVAVSSLNPNSSNRVNKVYAGTEPSEFYISNDAGDSWIRMEALKKLPSSKSWSFPPKPDTHHIRWIEPDANNPDYVFAAIEAGALVQSHDGGRTWIDRNKQGPYDTHTLATHPKAPGRLYSSAGDGYFESFDYGDSWTSPMEGLRHSYLFSVDVDPGDPQIVIVSAAEGPGNAYLPENAETYVYRKDEDGKKWKAISNGLPEPEGTTITNIVANPKTKGEFYAVNNRGLFLSNDSGISWRKVDIQWPKEYLSQTPWALAIGNSS